MDAANAVANAYLRQQYNQQPLGGAHPANRITFVFPDGTTKSLTVPLYLAMPVGDSPTLLAEVEHNGKRASIVVNPY